MSKSPMKIRITMSIALALSALIAISGATATGTTVDFEGLVTGQTVNGQAGWTVEDQWGNTSWGANPALYDQEVVDDGSGNTVWRVSNAVTSGGLSAQPMSQTSSAVAGEVGAALWNDRGPDHTDPLTPPNPGAFATMTGFRSSFDFSSATGAPQPGLAISVSPTAKQFDGRMSYVALVDDGANGIDVLFYETGHTGSPWGTSSVEIASDLSYAQTHHIDLNIQFVSGLQDVAGDLFGNDIVTVKVNGVAVHTGSSWETYYASTPTPYGLTPADKHAVNSLTFAIRGTAAPGTSGDGYYIDNVTVNAVPVPAALPVGLAMLGAVGLRRHR